MRWWPQRPKKKEADREYLIRRERLRSEIELAKHNGKKENQNALISLAKELETHHNDRPEPQDLLVVQKVEAELCLFKPVALLYPTSLRLRSRFYRFDPDRRVPWEAELKRLLPDSSTIVDEDVLRQRLRHLTYELNEEAEAYNRLSKEKSRVVRNLTIAGISFVFLLLISEIIVIRQLLPGPMLFDQWLVPGMLAGALGAITSATGAIADESARRDEYWWTLLAQLVVRTMLGAVYAFVVLAAVSSQLFPMSIPKLEDSLPFVLALGFVAGFSDKLFGQTVSQLITKSSTQASPARRGNSGRGRGSS